MDKEKIDFLIKTVKIYFDKEEYSRALEVLKPVINNADVPPIVYLYLAHVYIKLSETIEAFDILKEAIDRWPNEWNFRSLLANVYIINKEFQKAVDSISNIPRGEQNFAHITTLIYAYLKMEDIESVINEQKRVTQPLPLDVMIETVILQLKKHEINDIHKLVMEYADKVEDNKKESFYEILQNRLWRILNEEYLRYGTLKTFPFYTYTLKYPKYFKIRPVRVFQLCEILFKAEKYDEVFELLADIDFENNLDQMRKEWYLLLIQTLIDKEAEDEPNQLKPDEILLDNSVFHYKFGSSKCFVWFTGVNLGNTSQMLYHLLEMFKKLQISLIVVFDKSKMFSLLGFGKYYPDLDLSIVKLNNLLNDLEYKHIATGANSGSGLSAIIYGSTMNVDGVLGINAVTRLSDEDLASFGPAVTAKKRIFGDENLPTTDSYDYIKEHPDTKILLFYSNDFKFDKNNAEYLKDFKNILLIPEDYNKHDLIQYYGNNKLIQKRFYKFFEYLEWV